MSELVVYVCHPNGAMLCVSRLPGLWNDPTFALQNGRASDFRILTNAESKEAKAAHGDDLPEWPGEWAAVESRGLDFEPRMEER
jgi:hypothetical protein